jgi:hypothetical protein
MFRTLIGIIGRQLRYRFKEIQRNGQAIYSIAEPSLLPIPGFTAGCKDAGDRGSVKPFAAGSPFSHLCIRAHRVAD